MRRPVVYLVEVTVSVDCDEVDTAEKEDSKQKETRDAIQSLCPSIGVFQVESIS